MLRLSDAEGKFSWLSMGRGITDARNFFSYVEEDKPDSPAYGSIRSAPGAEEIPARV